MSAPGHTLTLAAFMVLLAACSFDSSTAINNPQLLVDGGLPLGQKDAAPDAAPPLDASQPDSTPDARLPDPIPRGVLQSVRVSTELELDGTMEAQWQNADFIEFAISDSQQLEVVNGYAGDASVRFASLYDTDKLYFFFEVTDDLLVDDSEAGYHDDSIELYIDGLNDKAGPYDSDDHWLVIRTNGRYQSYGPDNIDIAGFARVTATGYNIEISIDRNALGADFANELGFNLGLNDDDGLGNSGVDAYGLWFVPESPVCEDCCEDLDPHYAWCDTTRMGKLQLLP